MVLTVSIIIIIIYCAPFAEGQQWITMFVFVCKKTAS